MKSILKAVPDLRPYRRPSVSVAYLQLLVDILDERGIPVGTLLEGLPVDRALLDQAQARLSPMQWAAVVLRAMYLTGDQGLGIEHGLRMRPTVHGLPGYAAMSSASLRQALDVALRYAPVRQTEFELRIVEDRRLARLELHEKVTIPVLRSFFVEDILLGMLRTVAVLLGRELLELKGVEICFDTAEPAYFAGWRERLPPVRFGQACNALLLPRSYLELRPVLADAQAARQAVELCERELALVADRDTDVVLRVRAELVPAEHGGYPSLEQVAARLLLSSRSLKRRLQAQDTSFLLLLDEARLRDARQSLEHSALSVQAVAARLGYTNPANFTRAFQRWTGASPSAWRARRRG